MLVHDPAAGSTDARVMRLGPDLSVQAEGLPFPIRPFDLLFTRSGLAIVSGAAGGRTAAVLLCRDPTDPGTCRSVFQALPSIDPEFSTIQENDAGGLLLTGSEGGLLLIEGLPRELQEVTSTETTTSAHGRILGQDGSSFAWHFETNALPSAPPSVQAILVGNHVYSCTEGQGHATIRHALFSIGPPDWSVLWDSSTSYCDSAIPTLSGIRFASAHGAGALDCDPSGCRELPIEDFLPDVGVWVTAGRAKSGHLTAFVGSRAFVRTSSTAPVIQVSGPLARTGGILSNLGGRLLEVGPGLLRERQREEWLSTDVPELAEYRVATVTSNPESDELLILLRPKVLACDGWSFAFLRNGQLSTPVPAPEIGCTDRVVAAAVGAETYVVASQEVRAFVLSRGELLPVELNWDDPTTNKLELAPTECSRLGAVAGGLGTAFIVGCDALFRVNVHRRPLIAVRTELEMTRPLNFAAARAECADSALIANPGTEAIDFEQGRVWRVEAESAGVKLVPEPANDRHGSSAHLRTSGMFAIEGTSESPVLLFVDALHRIGSRGGVRLDGHLIRSAATVDGEVYFETAQGSVFRAR